MTYFLTLSLIISSLPFPSFFFFIYSQCEGGNEVCNNHGTCHVTNDHTFTCRCRFGWTLSSNCQTPIDWMVFASALAVALFMGLCGRAVSKRLLRAHRETKVAYELLQEQYTEVEELTRDWLVKANELELMHRIDKGCEGAFAEVYLARWHSDLVAVKRLRDSVRAMQHFNGTIRSDFEREIRTLRRTRHRNVVLFYGAGEWAGCSFLVIEYCERGSLRSIIQQQPALLDPARCRRLAVDAARGMRFLHTQAPPQVHRDLKSANLLVTDNWLCKVADLGTARLIQELRDGSTDGGTDAGGNMLQTEVEDNFVLVEDEVSWVGGERELGVEGWGETLANRQEKSGVVHFHIFCPPCCS